MMSIRDSLEVTFLTFSENMHCEYWQDISNEYSQNMFLSKRNIYEYSLLSLIIFTKIFFLSGNTRVISQNALQTFQEEMAKVKKDPYKVVMRQTRLPISLLNETAKVCRGLIKENFYTFSLVMKKSEISLPLYKLCASMGRISQKKADSFL